MSNALSNFHYLMLGALSAGNLDKKSAQHLYQNLGENEIFLKSVSKACGFQVRRVTFSVLIEYAIDNLNGGYEEYTKLQKITCCAMPDAEGETLSIDIKGEELSY